MPCPIARSLERVGEWWSILILRDALHGYTRFDQFQKSLGIAPNMLTRRLNALVEAGLLERRRYSAHPPRDEYVLTARGRDFRPVIVALLAWGNKHFAPEGASVLLRRCAQRRWRPTPSWSTARPGGRSRRRTSSMRLVRRPARARARSSPRSIGSVRGRNRSRSGAGPPRRPASGARNEHRGDARNRGCRSAAVSPLSVRPPRSIRAPAACSTERSCRPCCAWPGPMCWSCWRRPRPG